MISYDPFFKTLDRKNVKLIDIENSLKLSSAITAKFRKNQHVSLRTIERICFYLDVPIEDVIEIKIKNE